MAVKTIRQALKEALIQEMRRDPRVVVIGEDVSGGAGTEGERDACGRRARRHQGADRGIRRKPCDRHADHRVRHHGRGRRRGGHRACGRSRS